MPNRDGTGPWGKGAGTGWGRGPCGCGRQRGWRNRIQGWFGPGNPNSRNSDNGPQES